MKIFRKTDDNSDKRDGNYGSAADFSEVVCRDLGEYIKKIKEDFGDSSDLVINLIEFDNNSELDFANIYFKELSDKDSINEISFQLVKLIGEYRETKKTLDSDSLMRYLSGLRRLKEFSDYGTLYNELMAGNCVFLTDCGRRYFSIATSSDEGREISESTSQTIIKGPKDAFTESAEKNVFLIRKRIKNSALRIEDLTVGSVAHTSIKFLYIQGIAKDDIVTDLRDRINKINIDCILDSGYIEELFKTNRYSVFPTSMNSERPDTVVSALLEGRVAIIVDGSPFVLTAPVLFIEFLQASEDYYHHFFISSLMRLMRYTALVLTLLVPAAFIAITTFHQEIIPTPLLISLAAQREGIPVPAFLEVFIMELVFEMLREAGIRMPRAIGQAISIVGALVLGQAAVEAGFISAAVVIVVSITAISSFAITNYGLSNAIRLLRFVLIFLGGSMGLYGITMALIVLVLHLCSLKSAGVPYISPMAPRVKGGNKDSIFRFPLWTMKYRPVGISSSGAPRTGSDKLVNPDIAGKPELR